MPIAAIPILLTRPEGANQRFLEQLPAGQRAKLNIVASPLIRIVGVPPVSEPLEGTAIFTSANGVKFAPDGAGQRAFCVGEATTRAAQASGWSAQMKGADANALVQQLLQERPTDSMVHYRGTHTRGDIAERLAKAGLTIRSQTVYDQQETPLSADAHEVLQGSNPVIVPLFSPRTARLFVVQSNAVSPLLVAAMSAQVAEDARPLHPAAVCVAAEPTMGAMVAAVEKLVRRASAG